MRIQMLDTVQPDLHLTSPVVFEPRPSTPVRGFGKTSLEDGSDSVPSSPLISRQDGALLSLSSMYACSHHHDRSTSILPQRDQIPLRSAVVQGRPRRRIPMSDLLPTIIAGIGQRLPPKTRPTNTIFQSADSVPQSPRTLGANEASPSTPKFYRSPLHPHRITPTRPHPVGNINKENVIKHRTRQFTPTHPVFITQ